MTHLKLSPKPIYHKQINQIEREELATGGANGNINEAPRQLAENIEYVRRYASNNALKRDSTNRLPLNKNSMPDSQGVLPYSVESILANFERNPAQKVIQPAYETGECNIRFCTEMSSNFIAPNVPWMDIPGLNKRRVMPVTFGINLPYTPTGYPLFRPTRTNRSGFLTFMYIGKKPIYTTLKGSISLLLRDSAIDSTGSADVILSLTPINPPKSEAGQNRGKKALAASYSNLVDSKPLNHFGGLNDLTFPIFDGAVNFTKTDNFRNVYVGSDNGYIATTGEADLKLSDQNGEVGDNVRTTKWMDISRRNHIKQRYIMIFSGKNGQRKSSRSRIQIKDADGHISYYRELSTNSSSYRIYRFPKDAVAVRIYYSGRDDDVDDSSIKFGALPYAHTDGVDPLAGNWSHRHFDINKDVVFYPGVEYLFELTTFVKGQASVRSWGYRFQSGGISFLFDASDIKNEIANRRWRL